MRKKYLSMICAVAICLVTTNVSAYTEIASAVKFTDKARFMEKLNRGTFAVYTGNGVYISWRLLGTENIENQAFDIYRNDKLIHTTGIYSPTCYIDIDGSAEDVYKVALSGEMPTDVKGVVPITNYITDGMSSEIDNAFGYIDIPISQPDTMIMPDGTVCGYNAGDISVADLDGDGSYEFVMKWNPDNEKDNSYPGYTGNVYLDAYTFEGELKWRIDLGHNIRAGAHYTQFIVYDFNCDGKAEMICKTAPGTIDGCGNYVNESGLVEIGSLNTDNSADYRNSDGKILTGPEYITVFDGESGKALYTTDFRPERGDATDWGDNYGNRCDRFLAAAAYLNGETPSFIITRGVL